MDELVSRALDTLGADTDRVRVRFVGETPPVRVDAAQLERALANVLENALGLSSPADPVEVTVSASAGEVLVRTDDRGPGLPEEDLERIFEPFEQGPGSRRGTGLGLAIARGFAEANGCRLWAEPRPGSGAAFFFSCPSRYARIAPGPFTGALRADPYSASLANSCSKPAKSRASNVRP